MDFPRFALSDGTRLYVADAGNDRVLVYNTIPTQNAQQPDEILGEPDEFTDQVTSNSSLFSPNLASSASNVTPSPTALAWDGTNLYVTDPSDFRILVFTPEVPSVQEDGVVNSASLAIYAFGTVTLGGAITPGDVITVTINTATYTYTVVTNDTLDSIVAGLVLAIDGSNNGAGDPSVIAREITGFGTLQLIARVAGTAGNSIQFTASVSTDATETATASDAVLDGGGSASTLAPGTIVAIEGTGLADHAVSTSPTIQNLPLDLGGVEVYVDGIRSPIMYVSPTQINAQIPYEVIDANSSSLYVRTVHDDGSITVIDAVGLPMASVSPGIYAKTGPEPRAAYAYHGSSYATGTIAVNGTIEAGDVASINIQDRSYTYEVQDNDTLQTIRDALIALINANPGEIVTRPPPCPSNLSGCAPRSPVRKATASRSQAVPLARPPAPLERSPSRRPIPHCAAPTSRVRPLPPPTRRRPAKPSTSTGPVWAWSIRRPPRTPSSTDRLTTAPLRTTPVLPVSALAGGSTSTVFSAGLAVGMIGIYEIVLEINSTIETNPFTQLTISQDIYTSNIVTIPVYQPNPQPAVPICGG